LWFFWIPSSTSQLQGIVTKTSRWADSSGKSSLISQCLVKLQDFICWEHSVLEDWLTFFSIIK
jgi:hypothetical protein